MSICKKLGPNQEREEQPGRGMVTIYCTELSETLGRVGLMEVSQGFSWAWNLAWVKDTGQSVYLVLPMADIEAWPEHAPHWGLRSPGRVKVTRFFCRQMQERNLPKSYRQDTTNTSRKSFLRQETGSDISWRLVKNGINSPTYMWSVSSKVPLSTGSNLMSASEKGGLGSLTTPFSRSESKLKRTL